MADTKQYDFQVVQAGVEYDNFLYVATIQPEYEREGLELVQTGRYHVILLWPLGTVHFIVYKKGDMWDIEDVEEETEEESTLPQTGEESETEQREVNPLSLEAIIPDVVLQSIGSRIEESYPPFKK